MIKFTQHYPDWKQMYQEGMSTKQIGEQYGVDYRTVWAALKSMNVERRPIKEYEKHKEYIQFHAEWIKLYQEGIGCNKIAERYEADSLTILRALAKHGIARRTISEAHRKWITKNDHAFDIIDTPEKAYWLGFLGADGNVYTEAGIKKKVHWTLQVNLAQKDRLHLIKLLSFLESSAPLYETVLDHSLLKIVSRPLVEGLIKNGVIPQKSLTITFPDHIPCSLYKDYIRGNFDGDGWVTKGKIHKCGTCDIIIGFCSASLKFIQYVQSELIRSASLDVVHLRVRKKGLKINYHDLYRLEIMRKKDIAKLYHYLYDGATVWLDRKKTKFEELLKQNNLL